MRHPGVHTIAFTGSSAVGLEIVRAAAETPAEQRHVKRVVSEMGGKNCVIVDADADLDEAVPAIASSAFGYAGQKCSAAARVLAHEGLADSLLERLVGATATLVVGPGGDVRHRRPAGDRARGARARRALRGRGGADGAARAAGRRRCPARAGSARPAVAHELPRGLAGAGRGDLRAAARRRAGRERRAGARGRSSRRRSRSPRACSRAARRSSRRSSGGCPWATSTSTAGSRARRWAGSRSAATAARESGRRRAAPDYLLQFVEPRVVTENTMRHGLVVDG